MEPAWRSSERTPDLCRFHPRTGQRRRDRVMTALREAHCEIVSADQREDDVDPLVLGEEMFHVQDVVTAICPAPADAAPPDLALICRSLEGPLYEKRPRLGVIEVQALRRAAANRQNPVFSIVLAELPPTDSR